jgi:hypothetical protein
MFYVKNAEFTLVFGVLSFICALIHHKMKYKNE